MITKRLKNDADGINSAAEILKNGGIVAIPTETVYGLAASAFDDEAIKKIFIAKGRPQDNPLIVHISDLKMLGSVAEDIPDIAFLCAEKFWPGPLTLVLKKSRNICKTVSGGLDTVAVRMPSDKTAQEIIRVSNLPLAAPSANTSGLPSPTSYTHVINDMDTKIDAVVTAGDCKFGVESTVVTLYTDPPRLLRPGAVTAEQLRTIIPNLQIDPAVLKEPEKDEKVSSPGMKYKHYSPKTDVFLVEGDTLSFVNFVNRKQNAAAICFDEDENILVPHFSYGSKDNELSLAHNIFSILRKIDDYGFSAAYVHAPQKSGVGLAVYNRLIRAAGFKVITL